MDPSFAVCWQKSGLHYDADMIQAILLIVLFSEFFNEAVVGAGLGRLRTEDAVWMLCNGAQTPGNATSNYFLTPAAWGGLARAALSICWLELQAAVPRIACTHHYLKQKKTLIGVGRAAAARMEKWNETISEHRGNELTAVLVCPDHNISHFSPQRTFLVPPAARRRRLSNDSLIKFWHWLVTAAWCRYWEGRTLDTWCRPAQVTVVSGHSCRHLCMASVVTRSHLWASLVTTCGPLPPMSGHWAWRNVQWPV